MCFYPICAWLILTCCCCLGIESIAAEERYQRERDLYYRRMAPVFVTVEHHHKEPVHVHHVEQAPVVEKDKAAETKEGD